MNTPPPLPKPLQAKFSWIHYISMILVCLFVSTCTNVDLEKAKIEAFYVRIQNLQKQVHLQQEMIDFMREEIEEMADAETASQ